MPVNRSFLALGLAVICALCLMGLPQSQKNNIAQFSRSGLLAAGQRLFSQVIRYSWNEEKTRFLLTQNVELALDNMQLRESAWENLRLRRALQFRSRENTPHVTPAEVIGRDPDQLYDTIVINAGRDRGLEEDWPVVTAEGLVGHVAQVDGRSSVVQLLMRARVSALVQDGRAQGIVSWIKGNRFRLGLVEASSVVQRGDRVISSGLGGRYPKGIPIGVLVEVRSLERDPLFQEVILESNVDFLELEEVFVIRPEN
ncbi:MAG: rod shape-determining protein MreC [Gemmatimonadetes bacterium]|jgi:rod shape-determining protein MreC|nr:rod shape-determining protein MreC [Gemmatimonadota bacterium]